MTKIRTTHVGSLPRTAQLLEANDQRSAGTISDEKFNEILTDAVDQVPGSTTAPGGLTPSPASLA